MNKIFGNVVKILSKNQLIRTYAKERPKWSTNQYLFLRPKKEEYECIIKLLHSNYYPYEPTTRSIQFKCNPLIDEQTYTALTEGISLVAKCKHTGCIVGAAINQSTNPWDPNLKDRLACSVSCSKTKHLLHFHAHLQRTPDVWKSYDQMKIFELTALCVRRDDRGTGLGYTLVNCSRAVAADCGYQVFRVDAVNHYTALICEDLKMQKIYELPYCAYLGPDNKAVFNPPAPHFYARVYIDVEPHINKP